MKLSKAAIGNFRRLENVTIDVEERETVFVGPNNSGKTSATAIFRAFLGSREFKIHDFSVARIPAFDNFGVALDKPTSEANADPAAGADGQQPVPAMPEVPEATMTSAETSADAPTPTPKPASTLPEISLDLWFTIDPDSIAFGRVYTLLQNLSDALEVGLRLTFGVVDPEKLRADYLAAYPKPSEGKRTKTLFEYLSLEGNLARYCVVRHYSLSETTDADGALTIKAIRLDPDEGKRLVKNLVRAEFVDAQRNINDDEGSRANRLSTAFAAYYRKNLEQIAAAAEAHRVIDANNTALTARYGSRLCKNVVAMVISDGIGDRPCRDSSKVRTVGSRGFCLVRWTITSLRIIPSGSLKSS